MVDVLYDRDRVLHPLRRTMDGTFERTSWEAALSEIATRTARLVRQHGAESVAWYMGNPAAFSVQHVVSVLAFVKALGTPHLYSPVSQDSGSRVVASALLYGAQERVPLPDLESTSFLLVMGANPLVSNGSMMVSPRIGRRLRAITARGGRVVVVDPRRSETAQAFEHLPIRPSTDAWLLLSLLHVIATEELCSPAADICHFEWLNELRDLVCRPEFSPEQTAEFTGVPAPNARSLARDFATSDAAVVYGRTGVCTSSFGTLCAVLMDALNALTGNLDQRGGAVFGFMPRPFPRFARWAGTSQAGGMMFDPSGLPRVLGCLPAASMHQALAPHGGPVRAFFMSAGNPVLSLPGGDRLATELSALDLTVSIDLYLNESNSCADFVLPAATWLERADTTLPLMPLMLQSHLQASTSVVDPINEVLPESVIIGRLLERVATGLRGWRSARVRLLSRALRHGAGRFEDVMLRASEIGDWFGLRPGGLSLRSLQQVPGGVLLRAQTSVGVLAKSRRPKAARSPLPLIASEIAALVDRGPEAVPERSLLLVGRRDRRSLNSWMHNVPRLIRRHDASMLEVSEEDGRRLGIATGDDVYVTSSHGRVRVIAVVTSRMTPGCVSLPHGWGHAGGWWVANGAGGANVNALLERGTGALERLAGMARLNGIPVVVSRVRDGQS